MFVDSALKRVLFIAEAVTLAHVARIVVLARSLPSTRYTVRVACDQRYAGLLEDERLDFVPIRTIPASQFQSALAAGKPVYSAETLQSYVDEDLALIHAFRPDLIVGDFRLSLSVSARVAGVRYATVTNAYWSPFFTDPAFPIPVLPLTRWLPIGWAQALFDAVRPVAMVPHCRPLNRVREKHGLPALGNDLRRIYTDADFVLYADLEGMYPLSAVPPSHQFLGPLLWSPSVPVPAWWHRLPPDRPFIYLTLGSSGSPAVTWAVVEALRHAPVVLLVSSAGAQEPSGLPDNAFVAPYLPGERAAARASLVICNGGSMTCQQALAAGKPVLGIASNMDQFLNMRALVEIGAGLMLRADRLSQSSIRDSAMELLGKALPQNAAIPAARPRTSLDDASVRFRQWMDSTLGLTGVGKAIDVDQP